MEASHRHTHIFDISHQKTTRLALSLGLTLGFVFIEALAGYFASSLLLLTDAAHNLTDVIALALSWYAIRLTSRPADSEKTYGYHRVGIIVALINSTTLALIALGIFYEAYKRLASPPIVQSTILIEVGIIAFLVNAGTAWLVKHGSEHDLNLRSTYIHLVGDVISTIGAVLAGIAIKLTGLNWLDPLVSVFIGLLILWNAWKILKETVDILLESTPNDIDIDKMVTNLREIAGVRGVHDLHVWSITQGIRILSAHILIDDIPISEGVKIQQEISSILQHLYGIDHATLQLECENCHPDLLYCDINGDNLT